MVEEVKPQKLTLDKKTLQLVGDQSSVIHATVTPADATNKTVSWTSSDETVAVVDKGVVTAINKGTATITARTVNGLEATVNVTVTAQGAGKTMVDPETGVKVTGPVGYLPKGAELLVEPITSGKAHEQMSELTNGKLAMYDIKLFNKEHGQNVQPKGFVTVSIPIPAGYDVAKLKLYYFDEKTGKRSLIQGTVVDGFYVFEVNHFSYYVLTEEDEEEPGELVDKSKLQSLYDRLTKLDENDYTPDSWAQFSEKLVEAKGILGNLNAQQTEVEGIYGMLQQAEKDLKEATKPKPLPNNEANKAELQKLYDRATKLKKQDYTIVTWELFATKLAEAKVVLAKDKVKQTEVDKTLEELNTAMSALETTTKSNPDESNPDESQSDVDNNDNKNREPKSNNQELPKTGENESSILSTLGLISWSLMAFFVFVTDKKNKQNNLL